MSKQDEIRILRRSFSGDRSMSVRHRSGDSEGEGAALWDVIASVQSAEADMIDEEEREERREAMRKGIKVLRVYLRKVFDEKEKEFIKALISMPEKTPYQVGKEKGINSRVVGTSILKKWERTNGKLYKIMRSVGFDFWRGFEFLPRLQWQNGERVRKKVWRDLNREKVRKQNREYRKAHKEKIIAYQRAYQKAWYEAHKEYFKGYQKAWNKAHKEDQKREDILSKNRAYKKAHKEEIRAKMKAYREAHKEELKAKDKLYRETHKEEIRRRREARRKAKEGQAQ